jgi:hypothetical protein
MSRRRKGDEVSHLPIEEAICIIVYTRVAILQDAREIGICVSRGPRNSCIFLTQPRVIPIDQSYFSSRSSPFSNNSASFTRCVAPFRRMTEAVCSDKVRAGNRSSSTITSRRHFVVAGGDG